MTEETLAEIRKLIKAVRIAGHCQNHWYDHFGDASPKSVQEGRVTEEDRAEAAKKHTENHERMVKARDIAYALAEKLKEV